MKRSCILVAQSLLMMSGTALAQQSYQLYDATPTGDVSWSALGKINWKAIDSNSPWYSNPDSFFGSTPPSMSPYGDILSYTAGGVGDVDGDGYGDFAVTWYEADKDRGDPCGNHPLAWSGSSVVNLNSDERIGVVRVMSGFAGKSGTSGYEYGGTSQNCKDLDNYNGTGVDTYNIDEDGTQTDYIRRIGAPIPDHGDPDIHADFWPPMSLPTMNNALWTHEITTVGDIDGDGRDEMMISANAGQSGYVEIWAYTDRYQHDSTSTTERWVRLIVIEGVSNSTVKDELGYQSYEGPPPPSVSNRPFEDVSFKRDFNNDGQPDLLIASKFYRESNLSDRDKAIGAAWIFMLPKADVFSYIDSVSDSLCDSTSNRTLLTTGADSIVDLLPLQLTTDDFNVKITGHQIIHPSHSGTSTHYPRHFGFDISPAGDLDNDGNLDLAVSAPFHYNPSASGTYETYASSGSAPSIRHSGAVYFFLSTSDVRSGSTTFADLNPRHYYSTNKFSSLGCSLFGRLHTRPMSGEQIEFTSADADYYIAGAEDYTQGYSFGFPPFAGDMISGVRLNKGSGADNDPDLVVSEGRRNRIYVFEDIQSHIDDDITANAYPTTPRLLWDATESDWVSNTKGAVLTKDDGFVITSGTHSSTLPSGGMPARGIRNISIPSTFPTIADFDGDSVDDHSLYAGLSGVRIAGDLTGDGDCEIIISAQSVWDTAAQRQANVVLDVLHSSDADYADRVELVAEYLPERLNDATNYPNVFQYATSTMNEPPYGNQANSFNAGATFTRTYGVSAWPLWNPGGIEDMILGVRYFPRHITKYPYTSSTDSDSWGTIPVQASSVYSGDDAAYDSMTTVPAGKAYLVRSEQP